MAYAAVIAAAGLSSRMHEFKPLMLLDGIPLIDHVILSLRKAGIGEIMVVTGYHSEFLVPHLKQMQTQTCLNAEYAQTGMMESLCLGIRALKASNDGVFLTPGDVPLVLPETMIRMQERPEAIVRPFRDGKPGHPVLLRQEAIRYLLDYRGADGLRGAIHSFTGTVFHMESDDPGIHMDADTPEDFLQLNRQARKNKSGGRMWPEIHISIMGTEPVLTVETAQLLEMIDHTQSIANACACVHISYSKGWNLLKRMEREAGFALIERYAGGEGGGGSHLTAQGKAFLENYQAYCRDIAAYARQQFAKRFTTSKESENQDEHVL